MCNRLGGITMPRFPVDEKSIENGKAFLSGTDYKHVVKVLRMKEGDAITLFDTSSFEYEGLISHVGSKEVTVDIVSSRRVETDSPLRITLMQGLPKGDKMDYIIEKATELGVHTIVPVVTERSQVRTVEKKKRWERIAVEASKQCGRTKPPAIENTLNFDEAIKHKDDNELAFILHVGSQISLKDFLKNPLQHPTNIIVLIGPEGGFSEKEVLLATEMGFTSLGLGPRTLRTETAGIAVLSIIQFQHGDL
ncbi:MAG: 16S rRNA (uracil(1498)-N(3))-methyltransferase [Candidatus Dadabacteria bacterium]|nr:MAG: 16S rRNA (uracil(1498)-N(3))-methyltransferase [Candidatus Dadabacteria bacterium]